MEEVGVGKAVGARGARSLALWGRGGVDGTAGRWEVEGGRFRGCVGVRRVRQWLGLSRSFRAAGSREAGLE